MHYILGWQSGARHIRAQYVTHKGPANKGPAHKRPRWSIRAWPTRAQPMARPTRAQGPKRTKGNQLHNSAVLLASHKYTGPYIYIYIHE